MNKSVFGGTGKVIFKLACSATGTVILLVASLGMMLFQSYTNKYADQTVQMCRLVCPIVARKPSKTGFLVRWPNLICPSLVRYG